MNDWALIALGLAILTVGAEALIRGATALARRLGVSELLIGLTLVGFGTSAPELVASVQAALMGAPGLAVGNVVGSNIANVLLILGLAAVIRPILVDQKALQRDSFAVMAATIFTVAVAMTGTVSREAGAFLLFGLLLFIVVAYFGERIEPHASKPRHVGGVKKIEPSAPLLDASTAVGGLLLLVLGAKMLVPAAIGIAAAYGVSDTVVGLTIVAVGTSLPELVTSVLAAARGRSALAVGNIFGSNIYNLLGILGITALVKPVDVPAQILHVDAWVMVAAALAMVIFARTDRRISRVEGAILLCGYGVYTVWLVYAAA